MYNHPYHSFSCLFSVHFIYCIQTFYSVKIHGTLFAKWVSQELMETKNNRETKETLPEGLALEERLFESVRDRDESAFKELYQRCRPLFATIIGKILSNTSVIDEVIHEVMVEIWNYAPRHGRDKGSSMSWMITIARRRAIDRLRREMSAFRMFSRLGDETAHAAQNGEHLVDHEVETRDTRALLRHLLTSLPEDQRIPVYLSYFKGMSQRDLALDLQTPLGTIKTRIELGISKLGRMFRQFQAIRYNARETNTDTLPPEVVHCLEDAHFEERIGFKRLLPSACESAASN
jgi:RNA polymerase sigma-70 factor (ECF subfamily)